MPATPSSSAQAARQRLGERLRQMRVAARISGVEFARRAGWSSSAMVTMVEKGQKPINGDHVRLWCAVCGAEPQALVELLAEQAAAASMWATHAELNRGGLKVRQERVRDEYWKLRLHRVYQTRVPPGLLQTRGMMTYLLTRVRLEQHVPVDDVAEAVEARLARQECLHRPDARWVFLLEEDVLWYRLAPVEVHAEQLRQLLEMMPWPTVSLGIIPRVAERLGAVAGESFSMNDTDLVSVELISGYLNLTMPEDVRLYVEAWQRFARIAVHGERARGLIVAALEALDRPAAGGRFS
ncbi:helix-turn-helix transcriptional regulator [Sphaerisporangium sp. NPDC051011]|uniref:helix-turn-helix domain-containing protein n=1 Tax=Sphaerisporangium sp. NPDC051011 TaxID=3155792 RepID=UPI0034080BAB